MEYRLLTLKILLVNNILGPYNNIWKNCEPHAKIPESAAQERKLDSQRLQNETEVERLTIYYKNINNNIIAMGFYISMFTDLQIKRLNQLTRNLKHTLDS